MKTALSKDLGLLSLGAILYTLAFPPFDCSWAAWLSLAPLFLLLRDKTPRAAFLAGFLFGILWCIGIGHWVYFTVTESFSISFPLNLFFILTNYAVFAGLPTGIVTALSALLLRRGTPWLRALGIPALWVSGEFLRANSWFGVSWGILGYTQHQHLTLIQIADVTSVYGVSFLLALGSYAAAEIFRSYQLSAISYQLLQIKRQKSKGKNQKYKETRDWRLETSSTPSSSLKPQASSLTSSDSAFRIPHSALAAVGLLTVVLTVTLSYGSARVRQYALPPEVPPVRVALVQGNIPTEQRWQPAYYASTLLKYASVTTQGITGTSPDLVVWPEFAVNFYLDKEQLLALQLGQFAQMAGAALLVGAPRMEETDTHTRYYNSAYLFSATGQLAGIYDKMRLVPFAEYRPFTLPSVVDHRPEAPSEFTAGAQATVFTLPKSTFGITICYEAAFPYFSRQLVLNGAHLLVNISNDTWLGEAAAAVEQHFAMAVFRAVENKRYLVRTATAGISSFIDPLGHPYQWSTAPEGVIRSEVFPLQEQTFYTRYGDWFATACLFLSAIALFVSRRTVHVTEAQL
jgi:apolipoprotein N-acyltransferase